MDELCNFEASRMYASVDNNREATVSTVADVAAERVDLPTEISHHEPAYYERDVVEICHIVQVKHSHKYVD